MSVEKGGLAPLVALMGPTAAGKTALAIDLVQRFPFDIISVDSAMVYRGMDIGTGKPSLAELSKAPHRLIDVRDPEVAYSAAEFRNDALIEIAAIQARGRVPLLVGGTGLYFRALREGLSPLPRADSGLRERLNEEGTRLGWAAMHVRLARIDSRAAARIHPNDPQRIQRALEVYELSGRPMSELLEGRSVEALPFRTLSLVLSPTERAVLHSRIAHRFDQMLELGLVEEVASLWRRPEIHRDLPSMRAVGYRQVLTYFEGEVDDVTMRARAIAATRQLARRQLTWLRGEPNLTWLDSQSKFAPKCMSLIEKHLLT